MRAAITDADLLRIVIHGTSAFELLRTALEFDLFERLEEAGGVDLPAVAAALGVGRQPARILLLGLAALRLVYKDGDVYRNADITRRKLLRGSPRFVGPLVDVQAEIIGPHMGDFAESMRQNTNVGLRRLPGPGTTLYERLTAHPELQKTYYSNMGDASRKSFPLVLDRFDFGRLRHVVDLGGGDGSNAIVLAARFPHLNVTVFDQESVVHIAERNARDAGLADRVHVAVGDIFNDPFPEGIDAIMVFHIFEIWSLDRNTKLLRKCYDTLPEDGAVLLYNFVSYDDNTGPLSAALVSPYFLTLASGEGMTYAARDMEDAVRDAGFSRVERYSNMGFNHALVAGYK
jgi:cyclopropane fatty-acyl-phospholipid synthase-like methyltransferase